MTPEEYQAIADLINTLYIGIIAATCIIVALVAVIAIIFTLAKPVLLPYLKCRNKSGTVLTELFQKNRRCKLTTSKYIAEVYEQPDDKNPLAFFKSDTEEGYVLGAASLETFYDGAGNAATPAMAVAIRELKRQGYRSIDEVVDAYDKGAFMKDSISVDIDVKEKEPDPENPKKKRIVTKKQTITIPLVRQFDVANVIDYVKGKPAILKAYSDTKVNIDRQNRNQKFYENPQLMGLGFLIIAAGIAIGIMKALNVF